MTAIRAFHLIIALIDTCSVVIHSIGLSCFVSPFGIISDLNR